MKQQHQKLHMNCPMEIRTKGPHFGLYCVTHNKWMQWIPKHQLESLMQHCDIQITDNSTDCINKSNSEEITQ